MSVHDFIYKHRKKFVIGGVIVFLVILVVSIYNIVDNNLNSVTVNITVAPLTATVKIGEEEYSATETVKIRPGTYKVEVYADGFVTKTGELVAVDGETVEVSLYLDPTEENSDWYKDHVWDETARGDIISSNALQSFSDLKKKYPILNYVPYNTFTYTINYENECAKNGGAICLIIDAGFGFRDFAVEYLQSSGQDLSLYYVMGKNYEAPFEQVELSVPDGLEFDGLSSNAQVSNEEYNIVLNVANGFIDRTFNGYKAKVKQIKKYNEDYFGVTVAVYQDDGNVSDTYRMVVGRVDGEWRALTNLNIVLSRYDNPNIPEELLKLINNF